MVQFYFNPFTETVCFKYRCPNCHEVDKTDKLRVPFPNFAADNQSDSENEEEYTHFCNHCSHEINIYVTNGMYGGIVYSHDIPDESAFDFEDELIEDDLSIEKSYEFYTAAFTILSDIENLPEEAKSILYRLLYANAIAYMETFLGDTLKREATKDESAMRKFVENCTEFKKRKFILSEIYNRLDNLKSEILKYLQELLYHNLYVVKGLYKDCLDIDLGDLSALSQAVQIRHDIVHRNGKNKDGELHNISKSNVEDIWKEVRKLVDFVNTKIAEK